MKIILFFPLLLSCANVIAQQNTIRFIHIGKQTKPIGTLTITTEMSPQSADSSVDKEFETIIHTESRTYTEVCLFIKKYNHLLYDKKKLDHEAGTFAITISGKKYAYISSNTSNEFFNDLVKDLKEKKDDTKVIDSLKHLIL